MSDLIIINNRIKDLFDKLNNKIIFIEDKVNKLEIIVNNLHKITEKTNEKINKLENIIHDEQNNKTRLLINNSNPDEETTKELINNTFDKISQSLVSNDIKNFKKEKMNLPIEFIKDSIKYKDHRTILCIFRYYYKNKLNPENPYPIKIKGKRSFEYYNNQWIVDNNAFYIKDVLFNNIENELYRVNNLKIINDLDEICNNQSFILKLGEEKHRKNLFKFIVDEIASSL